MRWSRLTGFSLVLIATQTIVGCSDDGDDVPGGTAGNGGSTAGTGGKNTAGSGGSSAGKGGTGGTFVTGGDAGKAGGGSDSGGTAGSGGTGGTPECTDDAQCEDSDVCTDDACVDGACTHEDNTADCDDGNLCTSDDKCDAGECKGTNNTEDCDDDSTCTPTQDKCADGVCTGVRDTNVCPACDVPGNIIKNCDFKAGLTDWATTINFDGGSSTQETTGLSSDGAVITERDVITVYAGGVAPYSVQPRQEPILLKQGMKYKFSMVAGSDQDRNIVVSLTKGSIPYTGYSGGTSTGVGYDFALTREMKPFGFEFVMKGAVAAEGAPPMGDEPAAKLEIKAGGAMGFEVPSVVYFDDVYLAEVKCTDNPFCDDGNPCTDDVCNLETGICTWTNNTATCDDEDPANSCTSNICSEGQCTHPALGDGEECTSDADECTADICKAGVCAHKFDNKVCDCTIDDQCNDPDDPCTTGTCNENDGTCEYADNTAPCDDENACTSSDVCAAGVCAGTANTAACDDGDECTVEDMCAASACGGGTSICLDCNGNGNQLVNCDFASGNLDGWTFYTSGVAANASVVDGRMAVTITSPGDAAYKIQPLQGGITLVEGTKYVVRFNAKATVARDIIMSVTQDFNPYTSYTGPQTFSLTTELQQFSFEFTMGVAPVDPNQKAKLEFDLGGPDNNMTLPNTVVIDNVYVAPVAG